MKIKKFMIAPIEGYQYISKMLPSSCRYYPTCSEYAKWSFDMESPHKARYHSTMRILSCNQLFDGGIDYPIIEYKAPPKLSFISYLNIICGKIEIKYWLVPNLASKRPNRYHLIKDHNAH